ncbi:MAG: Arm DNA-binding domain-containing protein [Selenomonadaceae bacterium]|nr:Arm DNA-binding domain-containing protein [Selenomonadaceae bacterium]
MGKIYTRKRGSKWSYSFEATEYTEDGQRKRIEKGGFSSKKAAQDAGAASLASLKSGKNAKSPPVRHAGGLFVVPIWYCFLLSIIVAHSPAGFKHLSPHAFLGSPGQILSSL